MNEAVEHPVSPDQPPKDDLAGSLLGHSAILQLLAFTPPLVEGAVDVNIQVQPNGIDVTLREVFRCTSSGTVGFSNEQRRLSQTEAIPFGSEHSLTLAPGPYLITFNEVVHLPVGIAALGRTRSSLLRSGVALHTAVWDAGYSGRSQSLMIVYNPAGFTVFRDARIMQLIFFRLTQPVAHGYSGIYQGENV